VVIFDLVASVAKRESGIGSDIHGPGGRFAPSNWCIQGKRDFNRDGKLDILWRNTSGEVFLWNSDPRSATIFTSTDIGYAPLDWAIKGVGDFNADGKADILWRNSAGLVAIWESDTGSGTTFNRPVVGFAPSEWNIPGGR
jgi:hypothetical protein